MTEPTKPEMVKPKDIGPVGKTPLHFIWICDVSDSMKHENKIGELNKAIENAITSLRDFNKNVTSLQIFIRTIKFSTGAEWLDKDNISLKSYQFKPLESDGGVTDLGEALSKVAEALRYKKDGGLMPEARSKKPHIVLITDGYPTDDWESGLKKLMSTFWGENAVRMAVALGGAAEEDESMGVLKQFVGNDEGAKDRLLKADTPDQLTKCLEILSHMAQNPGEKYGVKRVPDEDNTPPLPKNDPKQEQKSSPAADSTAISDDDNEEDQTYIPETVNN